MAGKLEELVIPTRDPLGYPLGFGMSLVDRLVAEFNGYRSVAVAQRDIDEVTDCGGLWLANQSPEASLESVAELREALVVKAAREWVETGVVWGQTKPIDFVRRFLREDGNFDPVTLALLHLASADEHQELVSELATVIANFAESWPGITTGADLAIGPVTEALTVGPVHLFASNVDWTYGECRQGIEVNWPGAVLVRLVANRPLIRHVNDMSLTALMHTIATGCPPRRLVVYGLQSGKGLGVDTERAWLEDVRAGLQIAVKAINAIQEQGEIEIDGGRHCVDCPKKNSCSESRADDSPF